MFKNEGKQKRVLAAINAGAVTARDVEADLDFELTTKQCAGHLSNLLRAGKIVKTGETHYDVDGRTHGTRRAYKYGPAQ